MEERIQKLLSAAGICSRRTAETYITAGRVTVNGRPAALGERADLERDDIAWMESVCNQRQNGSICCLTSPVGM